MRAVDTNVLARYYLRDDPGQAKIASAVLTTGDVFVPKTVLLELEWVLRYVAGQPADKVIQCLAHLLALPNITVEDHDGVEAALSFCQRGMDFADAMHLSASRGCSEMLSFDRNYVRRATRLALKPPVKPPA